MPAVRILHTLFVCLLVPVYCVYYGPRNFLWFSDIALLLSVAALWREDRLIASTQALAVLVLEVGWTIDFLGTLVFGGQLFGLSAYMFDPKIPLFVRLLSLFHVWLPWLLLWLVVRNGYEPRALWIQTAFCCVVLVVSYLLCTPDENINWVYGLSQPQTRLPQWGYLALVMVVIPTCIYLPTHFVLRWATRT